MVKRLGISNKSEKSIGRIEDGININLNHLEFTVKSNKSLPVV